MPNICKRCEGEFEESGMAIARRTDFKTYYKNICKKCNADIASEWQKKHRAKYNKQKRQYMRKWRIKRQEEHGL